MRGTKARELRCRVNLKKETTADREFGRPYTKIGKYGSQVIMDLFSSRKEYQKLKRK